MFKAMDAVSRKVSRIISFGPEPSFEARVHASMSEIELSWKNPRSRVRLKNKV